MQVTLLDTMGTDLTVVNAARVSFDKHSKYLDERDKKLIKYLAKHNHWTPFGHCYATFRIKAPIFVARQLAKHQVGLVWNEVSRRYVDSEPEFWSPKELRLRAENVKQGSSTDTSKYGVAGIDWINNASLFLYNDLLEHGICPEQARAVLPQSMMTEWYWSGSLMAFARICKLRLDPHSQQETREVAQQMSTLLAPVFPVSWEALMDGS